MLMVESDVMLCVCLGVTDNVDLYVSGPVCVGVKHHVNE